MNMHAWVCRDGRLALYCRKSPDNGYWDANWSAMPDDVLRHSLRHTKRLGVHGRFFRRWLPRDGVVLEAGCGTGLWVNRLNNNGWRSIGVDSAAETIRRAKRICPSLNLITADIRRLPFEDETIAAYLSLGVLEHFESGAATVLAEGVRVLRHNGIALIAVPYINAFRKKLNTISEEDAKSRGLVFHQYYFRPGDLAELMRKAGLRPMQAFHAYGVLNGGLASVHPMLKALMASVGKYGALLDFVPGLPRLAAHMVFGVGIKE